MVQTGRGIPVLEQIKIFWVALFGYLYLFFATIFSDPKTLAQDHQSKKWGAKGFGGNMHGMKRGGAGPRMGGG